MLVAKHTPVNSETSSACRVCVLQNAPWIIKHTPPILVFPTGSGRHVETHCSQPCPPRGTQASTEVGEALLINWVGNSGGQGQHWPWDIGLKVLREHPLYATDAEAEAPIFWPPNAKN